MPETAVTRRVPYSFSFLMFGRPPSSTLFPYTTLFRSLPFALTPYQEQAIREIDGDLARTVPMQRSEEHTSELQSRRDLVCRLLLEKKNRPRRLIAWWHGKHAVGRRTRCAVEDLAVHAS